MAKDDYHVIVYQILAYLYKCLRQGDRPRLECSKPIALSYWAYIVSSLSDGGLIEGAYAEPIPGLDAQMVRTTKKLQITPAGIAYLKENGLMERAREFLKAAVDAGDVWEISPGIIKEII